MTSLYVFMGAEFPGFSATCSIIVTISSEVKGWELPIAGAVAPLSVQFVTAFLRGTNRQVAVVPKIAIAVGALFSL